MSNLLTMVIVGTLAGEPIIKKETEKAILIEISDNYNEWFPKSQVTGFFRINNSTVTLVTTPFMAHQKGLSHISRHTTEGELQKKVNDGDGEWL